MNKLVFNLIIAGVLSGCGANNDDSANVDIENNSLQQSTRISTTSIAPGVNGCDSGGVLISSGFDKNDNRVLDSNEISATQVICHGLNGSNGAAGTNGDDGDDGTNGLTSLIRIYDELAGENCANGGLRIESGIDLNSSTWLSSNEVESTHYLCTPDAVAGEDGSSCSVVDNSNGSATITCDDGTSAIITNGEDGANGLAGVDGSSCTVVDNNNGSSTISCEDGSSAVVNDGASSSLSSITTCGGWLDGSYSEILWSYDVFTLENGDKFISVSLADYSLSIANSGIYSPSAQGYDSSPMTVIFDVTGFANLGFWRLSYDSVESGVEIIYNDLDVADTSISWAADSNDCNVITYTN